jgi:hypothetical protein
LSLSTFGDLKATVASFLNRSNLTTQIPYFVQLAETKIAYGDRAGPIPVDPLRIRAMETSADITINAQTVALPTGYLAPRRLYLNTNPIQELEYIVPTLFWRTYISSISDTPTRYTIEGENFVFGPIPDSTYTGKSLYYKKLTALSSDSDTNWLLQNAFGAYLQGTLAEAYSYIRNAEKASEARAMFAGIINGLNLSDKDDRFSGSPWQAFSDTGNP